MNGRAPLGVEVPATSANLGPGFDALAVALDVSMKVVVAARGERRVLVDGPLRDELPSGDDNLVWRALVAYSAWAGVPVPDVSLLTRSEIPLERGMGSSAAAAVAGACVGRLLAAGGEGADPRSLGNDGDLVNLAAELEGHADNAAAAMLGGVVVCAADRFFRLQPSERLRPVVCIPEARLATSAARALLPDTVAHADAAANGARTAVVLAGLTGALAWQPAAMCDVLHEPARFDALPDTGRLVAALRAEGIAACLSGAGPSVLAIVAAGDDASVEVVRRHAGQGWQVRACAWDRAGAAPLSGASARVG